MSDILYNMACMYSSWKNLTYRIILGRKQQTYELMLHFPADLFVHLAGLHYLSDLDFKTKNRTLLLRKIINREITISDIQKSIFYEENNIKNRISNLYLIPKIIESADAKYLINANTYKTYTKIAADYLMEYAIENDIFYLFCYEIRQNPAFDHECICRSFFPKEKVDYRRGTMTAKVLLVQKIVNLGGENETRQVMYKSPVYTE